ncbi:MAG: ribosome hibernation-promoting factor, HPF/YfiA family [Polyangiales bacterium]
MQRPLQISFRGMESSPAIEERIQERVGRLERVFDRITSCHVTVEAPHQHHQKGRIFDVRIDLRVPGAELMTKHEGSHNHAHEDVYVALRDAFDAAERRLEDYAQRQAAHREPREPG